MLNISKELIESFAESVNQKSFQTSYNVISSYIDEAMNTIISRNTFIKSYSINIANEAFSGTEFVGSNIDLFLILNAKQLEINYTQKKSHNISNFLSSFAKEYRKNIRLFKRKKVSQKKIKKAEEKFATLENYDIADFYNDIKLQLQKQLYKTSKIGLSKNCITILGQEEFGQTINIYPIFITQNELYLYNLRNKKRTQINFRDRFVNLEKINKKTKSLFKIQIRIFNNIYYNLFKQPANQIFIESLIYSVPLNFYTHNIYETTIGIINYLKNCNLKNIKSICDDNIELFNEPLNTTLIEIAFRFIKLLNIE